MLTIKIVNRLLKIKHIIEIIFFISFSLFLYQLKSYANEVDLYDVKKTDSENTYIKDPFHKAKRSEDLRPIPNQSTSVQEKKLNLIRNPFSSMQSNSEPGNFMLSKNIVFTGIAKVGNENVVFADTNKGLSFLKVGSDLGNGYSISNIDLKESIINISNGILTYKVDFKKR